MIEEGYLRMRRNRQGGFSLIELLIVVTIIAIIATMAVPKLIKARMLGNETAALGAIKTLHAAEWQYNSQYNRFAQTLTELGPPTSGADNPSASGLISADLAAGVKQGYNFTLQGNPAGYTILATPTNFNLTGSRSFFSDQGMDVHESHTQEAATVNRPLIGKTEKIGGDTK